MIRSSEMTKNLSCVIGIESLDWPTALEIPSKRFRLFVAADVRDIDAQVLADFGEIALRKGMVYFCAWGPDCERFHDILDEVIVTDDLGKRYFAGPSVHDRVMTTWHDKETLKDAVEFFTNWARPDEGFRPDSNYWVAICCRMTNGSPLFGSSFSMQICPAEAKSLRSLHENVQTARRYRLAAALPSVPVGIVVTLAPWFAP